MESKVTPLVSVNTSSKSTATTDNSTMGRENLESGSPTEKTTTSKPRHLIPPRRRPSVTTTVSCGPGLYVDPGSCGDLAPLSRLSSSPDETHETIKIEVVGSFWNQIAGHRVVLKAKHGKICKPLFPRELWFYQSLNEHPIYKPFTARWYGCIELTPKQLMDIVGDPTKTTSAGSTEDQKEGEDKEKEKEGDGLAPEEVELEEDDNLSRKIEVTTWSKTLEGRLLGKLEKETRRGGSINFNYIVLQDITYGYKRPCCLDIKLGTRAYGDNATPQKIQGQKRKVASSTSGSLGMRLMGIKVYQPQTNSYLQIDKYEGRRMDAKGLIDSLTLYFRHGSTGRVRRKLVEKFVEKVQALLRIFESGEVYRMYSTSLLFVYEGAPRSETGGKKRDSRRSDRPGKRRLKVAKAQGGDGPSNMAGQSKGNDVGSANVTTSGSPVKLLNKKTQVQVVVTPSGNNIISNGSQATAVRMCGEGEDSTDPEDDSSSSSDGDDVDSDTPDTVDVHDGDEDQPDEDDEVKEEEEEEEDEDTKMDLKMIDFAHTYLLNGEQDDGYKWGLGNLINILRHIQTQ